MRNVSIAIDGPSGAGKSTISRRIAADLGFVYVDTGAIYRAVGLYTLTHPLDLIKIKIDIVYKDGLQKISLNNKDVTDDIRRHEVSKAASDASALPEVRAFLLDRQREMAEKYDIIMDGRDIGTVVLPNADVKIFLTASPEDRARRRFEELCAKGAAITYETVLTDITQRDYNDSHRTVAPLCPAADAIIVDTTGNEWQQSVDIIKNIITQRLGVR